MQRVFQIHSADTVGVAAETLHKGEAADGLCLREYIPAGHKVALRDIRSGETVLKYGYPIGEATADIPAGALVHTHNLRTQLTEAQSYAYNPANKPLSPTKAPTFMGYRRRDGRAAIRRDIYILPMVGCINGTAQKLCTLAQARFGQRCDSIFALTHPYGCSQLGGDLQTTQQTLAGLARNPNAFGVLLLFLGCENNTPESFLPLVDGLENIRYLTIQSCGDETEEALRLLDGLTAAAASVRREPIPASELVLGLKCGGSDAFSGITANVLCGSVCDRFLSFGASALLTETPEMFGAEQILMQRAENESVFRDIVRMIEQRKAYYIQHGQPVYENPSPGNKAGGITTLEEKSLGCIRKGGSAPVRGVLSVGETCPKGGLYLLDGVGNDAVSCTNLSASGAHMILFTTGRGTPFGAAVPTLKISTTHALARQKPHWIDFDGADPMDTDALTALILQVASGQPVRAEQDRQIAIFKNGVTL